MRDPERIAKERAHVALADALATVVGELVGHFDREHSVLAGKIMRAATDDERRETAADMRANDRLKMRIHEAIQRGALARKTLAELSDV